MSSSQDIPATCLPGPAKTLKLAAGAVTGLLWPLFHQGGSSPGNTDMRRSAPRTGLGGNLGQSLGSQQETGQLWVVEQCRMKGICFFLPIYGWHHKDGAFKPKWKMISKLGGLIFGHSIAVSLVTWGVEPRPRFPDLPRSSQFHLRWGYAGSLSSYYGQEATQFTIWPWAAAVAQELRVKGCAGLQQTELQQEVVPWIFDFNPLDGMGYSSFLNYPLVNKHRPWKSPIFNGN